MRRHDGIIQSLRGSPNGGAGGLVHDAARQQHFFTEYTRTLSISGVKESDKGLAVEGYTLFAIPRLPFDFAY